MKLFLAEKPSQGKEIAFALGAKNRQAGFYTGDNVIVTWCVGHLLELAPPETYSPDSDCWQLDKLPIIPTHWQYTIKPEHKKQLGIIQALLKKADTVVIATDADREGESIAREILTLCAFKGDIERLWLSALDISSIKKALASIKDGQETETLYQAALGRQRADWLIGMNLTMATTAALSVDKSLLSVGRVQTPTLKLIVDRDNAIANFKPMDVFRLEATFSSSDKTVTLAWQPPDEALNEHRQCIDRKHVENAEKAITGKTGKVIAFSETAKKTVAPLCFSLSSLQKIASSQLGLSAQKTLKIAQSLYETHKATTYPRTDCGYLPKSQFSDSEKILSLIANNNPECADLVNACDTTFISTVWNDKKITAHHGIIPTTNPNVDRAKMSDAEKSVYDLICRYYLAQFLGDYEYVERKVTVDCENLTFLARAAMPTVSGWKKAIVQAEKETAEMVSIPEFSEDETLKVESANIISKKTKPPARFTEGTLIDAMKNIARFVTDVRFKKILKDTAGMGTEATRATIIETLFKREFIQKEKKALKATTKGHDLIAALPDVVKNIALTAKWEQTLDDIAEGKANLATFMQSQTVVLENTLATIAASAKKGIKIASNTQHKCPSCDAPLSRRKGKSGYFWSCTQYPDCKTTLNDKRGKPVAKAKSEVSTIDCPTCKQGKLAKRQGKKAPYWACNAYPACQAIFWDKDGNPDFDHLPKPQEGAA